jgi:hypothetical protein
VALNLLGLFRQMDALLQLEKKHGASIRQLQEDMATLNDRVTRLEAREELVVTRAEGAAGIAAATAATATIADLARRIGRLEERARPLPPTTTERR